MSAANPTLFDDEFLATLEYLNVISKRFKAERRVERVRRRRGGGLEFADHRSYVPGDDFRHLDWKAFLRLNRLILKLFEEKEDLPIYLFLDASESMRFGQPAKLDYVRRVAAALCYVALGNLDRVNLVAFAEGVVSELPPQRGRGRIFNVFQFLQSMAPGGATNTRASFKAYCSRLRRRGLAVVISDFLDPEGFESGLDVLRHMGHDVFLVHVVSREEIEPRLEGDLQLVDAETQARCDIRITPSLLAAYGAEFDRHCQSLDQYCTRYQLGYVRAATDVAFEELVLEVFGQGRFLA